MNKTKSLLRAEEVLRWAIDKDASLQDAARHFGMADRSIRGTRIRYQDKPEGSDLMAMYKVLDARKSRDTATGVVNDGRSVKRGSVKFDKSTGELDAVGNKRVKTLEDLLKEAKVDTRVWRVDHHVVNKWDSTTRSGQVHQNWQVKAWLIKNEGIEEAIKFEDFFKGMLAKHKPIKYSPVEYRKKTEQNLLEVNIFDLHLGKLCWAEEVNNNYDIKIASRRFRYAVENLMKRANGYQFERIVFPVGNDFFNSDTMTNTTTMGTHQHEDGRWQKTFRLGSKLLVEAIDFMRNYAPVDVLVIPGNHDWQRSFFLGEFLSAWYRDDKSVTVDNKANPRKYYEYGNVLLGFTHGNNERIDALRSLMAHEAREAWARTVYKEFHLGHQHRKISVKHVVKSDLTHEELGIIVRMMSSLAGTDSWHHTMGYLGPTRAAEGFIWNKQSGLLGNINVNIVLNDDKE